jgi:putative MATE family efflux protein
MESISKQSNRRLRVLWRLSWPAILEQLLGTMVSYVDTAMVGVLGKTATAAVSINSAPIWLLGGILSGVGVGYSVQVANAVGARDQGKARRVVLQSLLAFLVIGIFFLVLLQLLAGHVPAWLGAEPDVLPGAVRYLRLYALGMPFNAALYVLSPVFRCTGDTKTPLILNTLSNGTNMVLNFFLIYPTRQVTLLGRAWTIPGAGMGVAGAAAASACAITVAGLIMVVVMLRRFHLFTRGSGDSLRPDRVIIRTACSLGLPYMAERTSINLGQIALIRIVASLGTAALAAHHIANTAEGLCYLPAYGISFAATALVGQAVGAQNREDAQAYGALAGKIGFALCFGTGAVLFAAARPLAGLFSPDAEVVALAALVLRIVSFCEPFFALSIVLSGALRGANDTRCPLYISLGCMWVVRIALTVLVVYVLHRGLGGVWVTMSIDLFLRGVLCALRWRSGKWQRLAGFGFR